MQRFKKLLIAFIALTPILAVAPVHAAVSTVTVTPSNNQGWNFNPDPTNATPYEFNEDQSSIGEGSLYVLPIGATSAHKFIAAKTLNTPVANVSSIAYDFLIAGSGIVADADQYYLNVYTNLSGSTTFYDCRFDYVPSTGSTTNFTTATFSPTDTPSQIGDRTAGGDTFVCPATLAGMPAGSTVSFITLNLGDTSASDTGLAGYFDKVVISTTGDVTTYDFEVDTVTVTIDKYINGAKATAVTANNSAFPMSATWSADNIGSGTGTYELDADGFNGNSTPYQAITSEMTKGADYTTNEILTGSVVVANCTVGGAPYALVGYSTGTTLAEAQAGTPSSTVPTFTDIQSDKYVIVWNKKCVAPPTNKDQCKNDGWKTFNTVVFKNQGDCVSFVATKGKNQPAYVNNPTV